MAYSHQCRYVESLISEGVLEGLEDVLICGFLDKWKCWMGYKILFNLHNDFFCHYGDEQSVWDMYWGVGQYCGQWVDGESIDQFCGSYLWLIIVATQLINGRCEFKKSSNSLGVVFIHQLLQLYIVNFFWTSASVCNIQLELNFVQISKP